MKWKLPPTIESYLGKIWLQLYIKISSQSGKVDRFLSSFLRSRYRSELTGRRCGYSNVAPSFTGLSLTTLGTKNDKLSSMRADQEQNFKNTTPASNVAFSSNGVVFCVFASCWIESMINMTKKLNDLKKYFILTFILHQMILFQKQ